MRAIPKTYSGVTFASTLEADWVSNLDAMSIRWQYEPEGVVLSTGAYYRPDFYLPLLTTHFEVKGPHDNRIEKPHILAADTMHAPGCENGEPESVRTGGDCACGYGPRAPYRLVVIARPATNGRMKVEGAGCPEHPDPDIVIACCGECGSWSFADLTAQWWCRRCHLSGKVAIKRDQDIKFNQIKHEAGRRRRKKRTA